MFTLYCSLQMRSTCTSLIGAPPIGVTGTNHLNSTHLRPTTPHIWPPQRALSERQWLPALISIRCKSTTYQPGTTVALNAVFANIFRKASKETRIATESGNITSILASYQFAVSIPTTSEDYKRILCIRTAEYLINLNALKEASMILEPWINDFQIANTLSSKERLNELSSDPLIKQEHYMMKLYKKAQET